MSTLCVIHLCFTAAALIPYGGLFGDEVPPECMVLVDIGYSFTHVIPLRDGQIIWETVKRCGPLSLLVIGLMRS